MRTKLTLFALTLVPNVASAHPGHGRGEDWTHHALEIGFGLAIAASAWAAFNYFRSRSRDEG